MSDNIKKQSIIKKIYDNNGFSGIIRHTTNHDEITTKQTKQVAKFVTNTAQQVLDATPDKEESATKSLNRILVSTQNALNAPIQNDPNKLYHEHISPTINAMAGVIVKINEKDQATLKQMDRIIPSAEETLEAISKMTSGSNILTKFYNAGKTTVDKTLKASAAPTPPAESGKNTSKIGKILSFLGKIAGGR